MLHMDLSGARMVDEHREGKVVGDPSNYHGFGSCVPGSMDNYFMPRGLFLARPKQSHCKGIPVEGRLSCAHGSRHRVDESFLPG